MKDLIQALMIMSKYMDSNVIWPTYCDYEIFCVSCPKNISEEDKIELDKLSFFWNDEFKMWASHRFGSN